ncbi:MAG: WG repeat-containing protein [Bacteroidota bacterium]
MNKEPENPGFDFFEAKIFFNPLYEKFNADSARLALNSGIAKLKSTSEELKISLEEEGINLDALLNLDTLIRDFLYGETLEALNLASIRGFRDKYPNSIYEDILIYKRDSIVFREVLALGTSTAFQDFIAEYPTSVFVSEADSLLDRIRYQNLISEGSLQDYKDFRSLYPASNMLTEVDAFIFQVSTVSQTPGAFQNFIDESVTPKWKKRAADIRYYLEDRDVGNHPLKDSIRYMKALSERLIFPVLDLGAFGFHNTIGSMQLPYKYLSIQEYTKCQATNDDWLFATKKDEKGEKRGFILLKDGTVVLEDVDDYRSISPSLAIVKQNGFKFLYHKSGFKIVAQPVQFVEPVENGWIKVKRANRWGLYSLSGLQIADLRYDNIEKMGAFWVFYRQKQIAIYNTQRILDEIEEQGLDLEFKFDDLELINDHLLIGFKNDRECLIDKDLNFKIPWGTHEIFPDPGGWYLKTDKGYQTIEDDGSTSEFYPYLESNEHWLALKTDQGWELQERVANKKREIKYDSIKLINVGAMLFKSGARSLTFPGGVEIKLLDHFAKSFPERLDYLLIQKAGSLGLYDQKGTLVFDGRFDNLTYVNDSLWTTSKNGKYGIINQQGEEIIKPRFETLDQQGSLVLTLQNGSIGCYDLTNNKLIPAEYQTRIEKLGNFYKCSTDTGVGLVDDENEIVLDFDYQEITVWNDTSFLVEQAGLQSIVNVSGDPILEEVSYVTELFEDENEKLFSFIKEGKFGLISNERGVLLEPEYSDINNIGDTENPIFFADQHLQHAGYHVVSYLNREGDLIFSKAYDKVEFEKIVCND